jgi:hypothetical protein
VLTTHPYPYFVPHCDQDPINTIRTGLHAASESLFYRGIGCKPCFVEELGTLGPMSTPRTCRSVISAPWASIPSIKRWNT